MMIDDDNDGQMIFGDLGGLKLPNICLTGEAGGKGGNVHFRAKIIFSLG